LTFRRPQPPESQGPGRQAPHTRRLRDVALLREKEPDSGIAFGAVLYFCTSVLLRILHRKPVVSPPTINAANWTQRKQAQRAIERI
jgi:hypothetical protein